MSALLGNLIGFQLVWMAAVGGAARGWWWAGPLLLAGFAGYQLALTRQRDADLRLMGVCALLGLAVDSLWLQLGWLQFASPVPWPGLAPVWIVAMWMAFALTLNHSLAALATRPALAAVFGLLGGPFAYWVAARAWGAVVIADGPLPYLGLALAWGVLTPLLLRLAMLWQSRPLGPAVTP